MTLVIQQDLLSRGRRRIIHNGDFLLLIAKVIMLQKLPEQKTTPPRSGCVTGSDAKPNEKENGIFRKRFWRVHIPRYTLDDEYFNGQTK